VSKSPDLRARTREAMRQEVAAAAVRLFLDRGFDAVTTTEIAAAAGISPRSFFRYFETKEDVVLGSLRETGVRVRDALASRTAEEPAWEALRMALRVVVHTPVHPTEDLVAMAGLLLNTPSIQARSLQKRQDWEELLVPEVAQRLTPSTDPGSMELHDRARIVVGAALAAMNVATHAWLRTGATSDPVAHLDAAMATIQVND